MANMEKPFQIAVSDADIELLHKKLDLTRFPDELDDSGKEYGSPLADMQRLVAYWRNGYDWRRHEAALNNELPQFTRGINIEGHGMLNIHYVHKKSQAVDAIPLLFVHGCK
jgi:Epoxide hydrolase N terminus